MDSTKKWWHPLTWLGATWDALASVIGGILRLFGIEMPTTPMPRHENLSVEDVDQAYDDASVAEQIADFSPEVDQRAHGFLRYIESTPSERAAFDLSAFDESLQDFILGLSEDDVEELRRRGPVGQLQAALIGRIPYGLQMRTAPEAYPEPSKAAELVRERFLRAVRGLSEESADSYGLDYAPRR
ncbi:hypothetical protein C3Y89_24535 [Rhizobium sp. UPM1132]|uniref:hypothetical protein n=1 Tax=Rhizobium ruizarguesonis TaxID=2081791 RepID=UPI001445D2EA|nr:hypothetical protein [Rhizobium ruizarguesonis]NKQ73465.1 hypothetical protein [Rhizobium ruizarguesonis]